MDAQDTAGNEQRVDNWLGSSNTTTGSIYKKQRFLKHKPLYMCYNDGSYCTVVLGTPVPLILRGGPV